MELQTNCDTVKCGDIVILRNDEIEICGYVVTIRYPDIVLSHEEPYARRHMGLRVFWDGLRRSVGRGDKAYDLGRFDSYEIVRTAETVAGARDNNARSTTPR